MHTELKKLEEKLEYIGEKPTLSPETKELSEKHLCTEEIIRKCRNIIYEIASTFPIRSYKGIVEEVLVQTENENFKLGVRGINRGKKFCSEVRIYIRSTDGLKLAESELFKNPRLGNKGWNFKHRYVEINERGKGWGNFLVDTNEAFLQNIADRLNEPVKIYLGTSQLDVLSLFFSHGYKPQKSYDRKTIKKIMSGKGIFLASVFANRIRGIRAQIRGICYGELKKDKMLLRKTQEHEEGDYLILRINLEKTLTPLING